MVCQIIVRVVFFLFLIVRFFFSQFDLSVIMITIFSLIYFQQSLLNKMGVAEFSQVFHDFLSFSLQKKKRVKGND